MKKIINIVLLSAFVTVLGASCNKNGDEQSGKYPILFRCPEVSRAETTVADIQENGFDVYSYFEVGDKTFNFEKEVTYDDDQGVWSYTDIEYWISGATYWFKAVYPKSLNYTVDNTTSAQNLTITGYDVTSQTDILVAEPTSDGGMTVDATLGAPTTGSVVNLQFKHLLANVVVKIKAEVNVTIQDISLKYVPVKCSYSNGIWSQSSQGNIEKSGVNEPLVKSNEYTEVPEGGFLVVPSSADGVELYVKTSDKQYNIKIPAINWAAGVKYIYTMTIKQNDIIFNEPTIKDWDEESATGSVVIK